LIADIILQTKQKFNIFNMGRLSCGITRHKLQGCYRISGGNAHKIILECIFIDQALTRGPGTMYHSAPFARRMWIAGDEDIGPNKETTE
jgi:hypothetical protein